MQMIVTRLSIDAHALQVLVGDELALQPGKTAEEPQDGGQVMSSDPPRAGTWSPPLTPAPYRIQPGDSLTVRVTGTPPESPIDGQFLIETEGTVALGPMYGRVEIARLTVREAEAAVTKKLAEILRNPQVQISISAPDPSPEPSESRSKRPTRAPYRLQPGDELYVDVQGALPDAPIDGKFVVEDEGTLPLGATYGRAEVAGLTVLEAEKAVKEMLAKILTSAEVQVTLLSRAKAGEDENPFAAPSSDPYR
jgi:protein involved in polysaccharide export with SLBB domain